MNDEWSRCPICFEDYSSVHRPTTFTCGHSTCIDHTIGPNQIHHCPICRYPLRQGAVHNVSYNLEEASQLFQLIKNTIDWSTITIPPPSSSSIVNHDQNSASERTHRDEIYARRLQAEFNRGVVNQPPQRTQRPRENQPLPVQLHQGHQKGCGHRCDLVSTRQCCTCSDQRPHPPNNRYQTYVDGQGLVDGALRNEYYCSTCKRR